MLIKKIEDVLNEQIGKEAYSSNLYLSMATWSEIAGFEGVSNWFYAQADEERMHMLKFVKYINERGGHAVIPTIDAPPATFESIQTIFKAVIEHEQYITNSINEIVFHCIESKDYTTHNWIQWFVNEQIEEEANVRSIIDKLKLAGNHSLYQFDRDIMGLRGTSASSASV